MVLIGALAISSYFGAWQQEKIASASVELAHSLAASEVGLLNAFRSAPQLGLDSLAMGSSTPPARYSASQGEAAVQIVRLQMNMYLAMSTGGMTAGNSGGGIRHRAGLLFRLEAVADEVDSSAVVYVPVRVVERGWGEMR